MFKKILTGIIIAIIVWNVGSAIASHWSLYTSHNYWQRYPKLQKVYYDSIYKNKHGSFLPDEELYSYIGGALVKGTSPILLNPEVPPFGTYLIGVSTLIFQNEYIIIPIFAVLSLFFMYLLGRQIFSNCILALIPLLLVTFEPIFKNQLIYVPLLDIMQLTFLLIIFYLFNKIILTKKNELYYFLGIGILLGFFIATKFFGSGVAVVAALAVPLVIHKEVKRIFFLLLTIPLAVIILYANYIRVLFTNYPLHDFLGIQKWVFLYNTGHLSQRFTVWPLLFLNKWYLWFGTTKVTTDSQWALTWPILTIMAFITTILSFFKKQKRTIEVLLSWVIMYLLLLSFVQISSRYFVILIPVLYIIGIYLLEQIFLIAKKYI